MSFSKRLPRLTATTKAIGVVTVVSPIATGIDRLSTAVSTKRSEYLKLAAEKTWREGNSDICGLCALEKSGLCLFHYAKFEMDLYEDRQDLVNPPISYEQRVRDFANAEQWYLDMITLDVASKPAQLPGPDLKDIFEAANAGDAEKALALLKNLDPNDVIAAFVSDTKG
jgi:hypothetical protein